MYFSISYQNTLHPTITFVSNYLFKSFSFLYLKVSLNDRMGSAGIIEIVLSLNLQLNISTFSAHHFIPYTLNELFHSALPWEYDVSVPQRDVQYQGCQLYRLIRETPDFAPFIPVSRVESEFSQIIAEVSHFFYIHLSDHEISNILHWLSYHTVKIERFLTNSGTPL